MFEGVREQLAEPAVIASFATIGLVGYVLHYIIKRKEFTTLTGAKAAGIGLGYGAVCGGLRVWLLAFDKHACELIKIDALYFFLAGATTVLYTAATIYTMHSTIKSAGEPDTPN